ncbi:MAG: DUF2505 domain-containing protein [Pseudonocardia sp.]|nr:DUF2505 domain-containing protein [Pseudonocardia sp.]
MPATIEHRADWDAPAATVYGVLTDADYLTARLEQLGGKDPALLEHASDDRGARFRLRHSVTMDLLPPIVRSMIGGDLVLDRVETWTPRPVGGWHGTVVVTVRGLPGSLSGTQRLADTGNGTSASHVSGAAEMPLPVLGKRIEEIVGEHVIALLEAEDEFTRRWLATST